MSLPLQVCRICESAGRIGGADDDAGWVKHMWEVHGVHITLSDLRDFREKRSAMKSPAGPVQPSQEQEKSSA